MNVSPKGIVFIAQREACVTVAYQDGKHLSIGFGHNDAELKAGDHITVPAAVGLLIADVRAREPTVNKALKVPVAQHEFDALFSLYYQGGSDGLKEVAGHLNAGDRKAALAALLSHDKNAKGETMLGLAKRRRLEAAIFEHADYGDQSTIKLFDGNPREVAYTEIPFPMEALS